MAVGGERSYHVKNTTLIQLCRNIVYKTDAKSIARLLYRDPDFQVQFDDLHVTRLASEVQRLTSKTTPSRLTKKDADALVNIKPGPILAEWKDTAPMFVRTLEALVMKDRRSTKTQTAARTMAIGTMCIFNRNRNMSAFQNAMGLLLDDAGATDEVISLCNGYGFSVSPTTVRRRRNQLVEKNESSIEEMFFGPRKLVSDISSASKPKETENVEPALQEANVLPNQNSVEIDQESTSQFNDVMTTDHVYSPTIPLYDISGFHRNLLLIRYPQFMCDIPHEPECSPAMSLQSYTLPFLTVYPDQTALLKANEVIEPPSTPKVDFRRTCDYEVIGDNFDIVVDPTVMTNDKQRKSWHWFLIIAKRKSVIFPDLPNDGPKADIRHLETSEWLPSQEEETSLNKDFEFHIAKILCKHLTFLEPFKSCVPKHITHPYLRECSRPTLVLNSDLVEASENSSEGMITINNKIHLDFVPRDDEGNVAKSIVFGGDVLTNERAHSAQQNVRNGRNLFSQTAGVIHRPEGLHREMNFVLLIYQLLYKQSEDPGSLYQLRNLVNRKNVKGADNVIKAFRPHQKFLDDALEAFILAAAIEHFGLEDHSKVPTLNKPSPLLLTCSAEAQNKWINKQARMIFNRLILDTNEDLVANMQVINDHDQWINSLVGEDGRYHCPHCAAVYITVTWFEKHLTAKHNIQFQKPNHREPDVQDHAVVPTLVKLLLLQHDTADAYSYGDGDRCMRNAKFEFLYLWPMKHTKYRLWLWRMLAYDQALLSEREAKEYRWNQVVNTKGGIGKCIPNDNFVETQVKSIKKNMARQGPNKSFHTARVACKTTQVVAEILGGLQSACGQHKKGGRSDADTSADVREMAKMIRQAGLINNPGQTLEGFETFHDPLSIIKPLDLHQWIKEKQQDAFDDMTFE